MDMTLKDILWYAFLGGMLFMMIRGADAAVVIVTRKMTKKVTAKKS